MSKNFFLLAVTFCTSCAFAQKSFFGVDAGFNVANERAVTKVTSNGTVLLNSVGFQFNQVAPTAGFFYHLGLSETAGIRVGARYMGMGYKNKADSVTSLNINYLTFPLSFAYHVNERLSFNSGAYLSFTLGGTKINNEEITKTYHKNDFGISLGAEYDLYKNFSMAVNYFIGLKNIWLNDTQALPAFGITINSKHTTRALQFTVIYKFKKTK